MKETVEGSDWEQSSGIIQNPHSWWFPSPSSCRKSKLVGYSKTHLSEQIQTRQSIPKGGKEKKKAQEWKCPRSSWTKLQSELWRTSKSKSLKHCSSTRKNRSRKNPWPRQPTSRLTNFQSSRLGNHHRNYPPWSGSRSWSTHEVPKCDWSKDRSMMSTENGSGEENFFLENPNCGNPNNQPPVWGKKKESWSIFRFLQNLIHVARYPHTRSIRALQAKIPSLK